MARGGESLNGFVDSGCTTRGELELPVARHHRHRVGQVRRHVVHVGHFQRRRGDTARGAFVHRESGVGAKERRVVLRCHGEVEHLTSDRVALAVVHREGEAVAGGLATVVHVHQQTRVDVGLGERGNRRSRTRGQLELAVGRYGRYRVSHARRALLGVGVLELGHRDGVGAGLEDRAAGVGRHHRWIVVHRRHR